MSPEILENVVQHLRAIRTDRFDRCDPESVESAAEREILRELNALSDERSRILRENQARYRLIINSTPVAICITDENGYYEYVNPQYQKLTGYDESELIGRHFSLVVPEDDRATLNHLHDEFMGRRYELEGQWTIVGKDGRPIPILANAAYIIDVDEIPKKVTYVIDVSELIETQTRLEAEIARRTIHEQIRDQVERVMRHDLRNPLDGIHTAAEFLLQEDEDPRRREFIRLMLQAADQARDQIDNSLAYARMQRGQYRLQRSRLNLIQVIRSVQLRVADASEAYDVAVTVAVRGLDPDSVYDVEVWGEQRFLADAFTNLVRNAIEASEHGGRVTIDVDDAVIGASRASAVSVAIHNDIDIPEEIRGRVFDAYVTSGKRDGTGLGAYTAHLVVTAHGGRIEVDTGQGGGTTIRVVLPRGRYGEEEER
jgi:PAS domain S-box-containing protein